MPRPGPDPAKVEHAAKLYTAGQTLKEAGAVVGVHPDSLSREFKRLGVAVRPPIRPAGWNRIDMPADVPAAYLAGETEQAIALRLGVARTAVKRWLVEAGIKRRGLSESQQLRNERLTPEERKRNAQAAHNAKRGTPNTEEQLCKMAATREATECSPYSAGTARFCDELDVLGVSYKREKAVGRYNVDVALTAQPVAVEVLGGYWHGYKRIHARRTPYILDRGWHIAFVWDTQRMKISAGSVREIVALAERTRRNPPSACQYWVVRGDGKLVATGCADDDEFPLEVPSEAVLN